MTDTSPEMMQHYREMLLARTPAERMIMGAQMFDAACAMILGSLPPGLPPDERRRRLFARLYGKDIPAARVPEALRPR